MRPDGDSGDALSAGKCEALSPLAAELREADLVTNGEMKAMKAFVQQ